MAFSNVAKPLQNQSGLLNSLFSPQQGKKATPETKKKKKDTGGEEYLAGNMASGMGQAVGAGVASAGGGVLKFIIKYVVVPIMKVVGLGGVARAIDKAVNPVRTFMEFLKYRNWYEVGLASDAKKVWRSGGKIINGIEIGRNFFIDPFKQIGKFIKNRALKRPWSSFKNTVLKGGLTTAEIAKNIKLWWQGTNIYRIVRFLTNKKMAGPPVSWVPRGWWRKVLDIVNTIKASGIGRWISGVRTTITSSRVFRGLVRLARFVGRGWDKLVNGVRWVGVRAGRALGFGVKWFNRGFFVFNVGSMAYQLATGRPLLEVLNPFFGVSLQNPLAFLNNPSFWVAVEAVGSRAVKSMLVRGGTWIVRTVLPRIGAWVVTTVIPWVTAVVAPAVVAFVTSAIGAVSTAMAGVASAAATMFGSAAFAMFISIVGTIMAAAAVIGGAIFMVTVAQNRSNPPASTKIEVKKTMVVVGDTIKATVVLTAKEPVTIWSVKDKFYYIPNSATCTEAKQEVNHANGFGSFDFIYDVPPAHASATCQTRTCTNCDSLGWFPGTPSGTICNNLMQAGEQRTFSFELKGFKGSSVNDSTAKGTYWNEVTVNATESLGLIENAYGTAKLDIGGTNACMAKYEAPCGCPLNLANPAVCLGANLQQSCNGGFSHQGLEAVDVSTTDGATIYAPISGTLTRWIKTTRHCDPATQPPGVCNGFGMGVYLILENPAYKIIIGHLKATVEDVRLFDELCDPNPYCGSPVQVGNAMQVSRGAGIAFADNTGYSTNNHIHYEIKKMPENFSLCPSRYDGGSLLDNSSNICQGVPPL